MVKKKRKAKKDPLERQRLAAERERNAKMQALAAESTLGARNLPGLRRQLRDRLLRMKLPLIKEDVAVARRTFQRTLDSCDFRADKLLGALDQREEESRRNGALCSSQMERLAVAHEEIALAMHRFAEDSTDRGLNLERTIGRAARREHKDKETHLKAVSFATEERDDLAESSLRNAYALKLENLEEENKNVQHLMRQKINQRIQCFKEEIRQINDNYDEDTKKRRKDFEVVRKKDEEDQATIARQGRRIQLLYSQVQQITRQTIDYHVVASEDVAYYSFERDFMMSSYFVFQRKLLAEQALDKKQLRTATMAYDGALQYLKQVDDKVEKIVSLVEACRKLESFDDQLLVYPLSATPQPALSCAHDLAPEIMEIIRPMHKFAQQIKVVDEQNKRLRKYLHQLQRESDILKNDLRLRLNKFSNPLVKNFQHFEYETVVKPLMDCCQTVST